MWDLRIASPLGRLSMRNMLIFVATTVATAFAFMLVTAPTAHAADVAWNGDSLMYGGNQYQKAGDAKENDSRGFPKGTHIYTYIEGGDDTGTTDTPSKAHTIYFPPNDDPTKAKTAKYAVFDFIPPDTFKNPTGQKSLSVGDKSASDSEAKTSCGIPSVGWILCPISGFMARSMDWMYSNVLTQFLAVRPVQSNTDNSLFKAWDIMRNFANVAFVIAFLVIIWSQVSSMGISNYGIKKLLPRLVVAAILVNVSYWICALAIDVSNILGYSINDLLMSVTETVRESGNIRAAEGITSWESITAAVLSGGTLAAAGITSLIAVGSISGAIAMLLPILIGVLIAALVAIIIMAARQAIIVILVIVSPLAFVAYLLPNTEKYFEKWKDLFITMLVLFPVFGVIFGGSQLAGIAILQNADSIIMLILGMAVQVAPLVLLPFLVKFSGSLLGRIAGAVDNRSKGLIDRSRGFATDYAGARKAKTLARSNTRWRPLSRAVQSIDNGRRKREGMQKANEALADARWEGHKNARKVHEASARASLMKEAAEARSEQHIEALKRTNAGMQGLDLKARAAKLDLDLSKAKVETNWKQFKAGDGRGMVLPENLSVEGLANFAHSRQSLARNIQQTAQEASLTDMRQEMAKRKQAADLSTAMLKDTSRTVDNQTLLKYAGGSMGTTGADTALSKAITIERKEFEDTVNSKLQLMKHFDVSNPDKSALSLGEDRAVTKNGVTYTFNGNNPHVREAAIADVFKSGSYAEIEKIILSSGKGGVNEAYAGTISREIVPNGANKKALFFGSKIINDIGQGLISGEEGRTKAITYHIKDGKVKAETLAGMDAGALQHMFDVVVDPQKAAEAARFVQPEDRARYDENVRALRSTVQHVIDTDIINVNASEQALKNMRAFLESTEGKL